MILYDLDEWLEQVYNERTVGLAKYQAMDLIGEWSPEKLLEASLDIIRAQEDGWEINGGDENIIFFANKFSIWKDKEEMSQEEIDKALEFDDIEILDVEETKKRIIENKDTSEKYEYFKVMYGLSQMGSA